jgi:hypothetical protein
MRELYPGRLRRSDILRMFAQITGRLEPVGDDDLEET